MKNLRFIGLLVTVVLLAFGLTIACDNGTTKDETPEVGSKYTGSSDAGTVEIFFSNKTIDSARARAAGPNDGDFYLITVGGAPRSSGTIQISGSTITFTPDDGTPSFIGSIANDVLTITGNVGGSPLSVRATDPNTGTSPNAPPSSGLAPVAGPGNGTTNSSGDTIRIPPRPTAAVDSPAEIIAALGGSTVARESLDRTAIEIIGDATVSKTIKIDRPINVEALEAKLTIAKDAALYAVRGFNLYGSNSLTLDGPGALVLESRLSAVASGSALRVYDGTLVIGQVQGVLDTDQWYEDQPVPADLEVDGTLLVQPATTNSKPMVVVDGGRLWIGLYYTPGGAIGSPPTSGSLTVNGGDIVVKGRLDIPFPGATKTGQLFVQKGSTFAMNGPRSTLTIGEGNSMGRVVFLDDGGATRTGYKLSNLNLNFGQLVLNGALDTAGGLVISGNANIGDAGKPALFQIANTNAADATVTLTESAKMVVKEAGELRIGRPATPQAGPYTAELSFPGTVKVDIQSQLIVDRRGLVTLNNGTSALEVTQGTVSQWVGNSGGTASKLVINEFGTVNVNHGTLTIYEKGKLTSTSPILTGLEINKGVLNIGDGTASDALLTFPTGAYEAKAVVDGGTIRLANPGYTNTVGSNAGKLTITQGNVIEVKNGGTVLLPKAYPAFDGSTGSIQVYRGGQLVEVGNGIDTGTAGPNGYWYPVIGTASSPAGTIQNGLDLYEEIAAVRATAGSAAGAEYIVNNGYIEVFNDSGTPYYVLNGDATVSGVRVGSNSVLPTIAAFTVAYGSKLTVDVGTETGRSGTNNTNQTGPAITSLTVYGTLEVPTGNRLRIIGATSTLTVGAGGVLNNAGTIQLGSAAIQLATTPPTTIPAGSPVAISAAIGTLVTDATAATGAPYGVPATALAGIINNNTGGLISFNSTPTSVLTNNGTLNNAGGNINASAVANPIASTSFTNSATGVINVSGGSINLGQATNNGIGNAGTINVTSTSGITVIANSITGAGAVYVTGSIISGTPAVTTVVAWLPSGAVTGSGTWPGK